MKKSLALLLAVAAAWASSAPSECEAVGPFAMRRNFQPWHAGYYDPQWAGVPHAMVVPPTTRWQVKYSSGVSGTEQHRIRPQYHPGSLGDPGMVGGGAAGMYTPAPVFPSHTDQMGTYYIRMTRD